MTPIDTTMLADGFRVINVLSMKDIFGKNGFYNSVGVYEAKQTGIITTQEKYDNRANLLDKMVPKETPDQIATREAANILAVQKQQEDTAKEYHLLKDKLAAELIGYGGSEATAAACLAMVTNPFNKTQVELMKSCFAIKIQEAKAIMDAKYPQPSPSSSPPEVNPADETTKPELLMAGMSWNTTYIAIASAVALLGFLGFKYYQSHKTKHA